ncbi:MAG: HU family DNA-binding protein [Bdellovibrionota bacterium]
MNKTQLIDAVSRSTRTTKVQTETLVNATLDAIKRALSRGEPITLVGFGTFSCAKRRARIARNPRTGLEMALPAKSVPKFKAGRELREMIR